MAEHLSGIDIHRVMRSQGPVVKCVLLRAPTPDNAVDPSADAASMKIRQIKLELTSYGVDPSAFVEKGEMVKALLAAREGLEVEEEEEEEDGKPAAEADGSAANDAGEDGDADDKEDGAPPQAKRTVPLQHLIEEVEIDTTPKRSMVAEVLGGPFTFLGQYEDEGIMVRQNALCFRLPRAAKMRLTIDTRRRPPKVMIRRPDWEDEEGNFDGDLPPVNGHPLQPPLDRVEVRGDVLLMKVAETEEELDGDGGGGRDYEKEVQDAQGGEDEKPAAAAKPDGGEKREVRVPTNDEFFLDYTRDEYLAFASRTDVVAPAIFDGLDEDDSDGEEASDDEGEAEGEEGDSDSDGDFDPTEDVDDEASRAGVMNMILGHMLKKFREENGRGPDGPELLAMRKALADKLGGELPGDGGGGDAAAAAGVSPEKEEKKKGVSDKRVTMAVGEGVGDDADGRKREADAAAGEAGPDAKRPRPDADVAEGVEPQ